MAVDVAAVLLDDAITNTQAEAGFPSRLFRGEERIETFIGLGNSIAVIAKRNLDRFAAWST